MTEKQQFLVRFWGVRGSYPTPGKHTVRHGGNTACVEVQVGGQILIFDAGTGIIRLGEKLMHRGKEKPLRASLFITHAHSDHLVGFPFFAPLFDPSTSIHLFGPNLEGLSVEQLTTSLMSPPYFPVDVRNLPSHRTYHMLANNSHIYWGDNGLEPTLLLQERAAGKAGSELHVSARLIHTHPMNGALVYRIEYAGRRVVYATDVEWSEGCEADFLEFVEGADVLIHDAQYTAHDYQRGKRGFGHSTIEMATQAAYLGHVRELILFHHEPTYDDNQLDRMEAKARAYFAHTRSAHEGMEIALLP
jgi:phosphoribosyl 1,2-cyclic phosphodiesterase